MQQPLPFVAYVVLLFVGLSLDEGDGCFEDAQDQGAHTAGMRRDVASAAKVAGLQAGQLLFSQLAQPADTSPCITLPVERKSGYISVFFQSQPKPVECLICGLQLAISSASVNIQCNSVAFVYDWYATGCRCAYLCSSLCSSDSIMGLS